MGIVGMGSGCDKESELRNRGISEEQVEEDKQETRQGEMQGKEEPGEKVRMQGAGDLC